MLQVFPQAAMFGANLSFFSESEKFPVFIRDRLCVCRAVVSGAWLSELVANPTLSTRKDEPAILDNHESVNRKPHFLIFFYLVSGGKLSSTNQIAQDSRWRVGSIRPFRQLPM